MSRSRRSGRRRGRREGRPPDPHADAGLPGWIEFGGKRMFAVGFTAGGFPYGVTEEEVAAFEDEPGGDPRVGSPVVDGPPPRRKLAVDMLELEAAFEEASWEVSRYLDLETGEVLVVTDETRRELEEAYGEAGQVDLATHVKSLDLPDWMKDAILEADRVEEGFGTRIVGIPRAERSDDYDDLEAFIATVSDSELRDRLDRAVEGRGGFRRFREALASHRGEQRRWVAFQRGAVRSRIVRWLRSIGVEPVFEPLPEPELEPPPRPRLLAEALGFVRAAAGLPGVRRIALVGSLVTDREWPKDVDLLVTVDDAADLAPLAKLARRLQGHAQSMGLGADVFLADPAGRYLGRSCPWSRCGPRIRASCDALHCGRRQYLHDDLKTVRLADDLVAAPPVELWPAGVVRAEVPDDVLDVLLAPLAAGDLPAAPSQ